MTQDLIDTIMKTEKYILSEPIKTKLGIHLLLVCESEVHTPKEKESTEKKPQSIPGIPS